YHLFLRPTAPTALFSLSLHDALPIFASMQSNPDATAQTPHLEVVQEYVMLRDQVRSKMLGAGYKSTGNSPTSEFRQTELYKVWIDRKSTRLNSSHVQNSYAVFCLKKK